MDYYDTLVEDVWNELSIEESMRLRGQEGWEVKYVLPPDDDCYRQSWRIHFQRRVTVNPVPLSN